jgi:pyruvate dehydrogenase E1 component alpha subunit
MHIADPATGNLGANAIVGGSAGIATGAAFSAKYLGNNRVVVCFFGEGALGQGLLYEEMNLASALEAPVIYACENNMYNEYTHFSETTAGEIIGTSRGLRDRRRSGGRPGLRAVYAAASKYVERARVEVKAPHSCSSTPTVIAATMSATSHGSTTAAKQEEQHWSSTARSHCAAGPSGCSNSVSSNNRTLDRIQAELTTEMDAAVDFAVNAPYPDPDKVGQDVYA